jgi:hypothetical protein
MESWRVTLAKRHPTLHGENGLYSVAEMKAKEVEEKAAYGHDIGFRGAPTALRQPILRGYTRSSGGHGPSARAVVKETDVFDEFDDVSTIGGDRNPISHSLAGSDTYGFTTTYELPTPRTIHSTPLVRRHVIAEIPLPTLLFTHILIPKLKAAAFLKAKVTNTSTIPLLQGQAGLTLDGSFMGNLTFPRCSPSETIVLELGVDQSVKVEYEKPTVKHGTYGMLIMGKEEVGIYKVCPR